MREEKGHQTAIFVVSGAAKLASVAQGGILILFAGIVINFHIILIDFLEKRPLALFSAAPPQAGGDRTRKKEPKS